MVQLTAFTLLPYSGKYSIRQFSKKSAFVQDAVCWQETWARHTGKCRGYPSHRLPITFMNDWIHGLMMTVVHDSHHGYIAQLWPNLWAPKELQWDCCSSLSLGRRALSPLLSGSSHSTLSSTVWQWSPARPLQGAQLLLITVTWQRWDTWGLGFWVCFPPPHLTVVRTSVGEWCQFPFCCWCFLLFCHLKPSLAIHLMLHCLHNYYLSWHYFIT